MKRKNVVGRSKEATQEIGKEELEPELIKIKTVRFGREDKIEPQIIKFLLN